MLQALLLTTALGQAPAVEFYASQEFDLGQYQQLVDEAKYDGKAKAVIYLLEDTDGPVAERFLSLLTLAGVKPKPKIVDVREEPPAAQKQIRQSIPPNFRGPCLHTIHGEWPHYGPTVRYPSRTNPDQYRRWLFDSRDPWERKAPAPVVTQRAYPTRVYRPMRTFTPRMMFRGGACAT